MASVGVTDASTFTGFYWTRAARDGGQRLRPDRGRRPDRWRAVRRLPPEARGRPRNRGRAGSGLAPAAPCRAPGIETPRSVTGASSFAAIRGLLLVGRGLLRLRGGLRGRLGGGLRGGRGGLLRGRLGRRRLGRLALALLGFAAALVAGPWSRATTAASASAAFAAAASARAVLLSAARALPAAVWAPLALPALPAAMRALAAFWAAALPVVLATCPPACTWSPPSAALTLRVRRDLRRAAAFGWMAPALAARSRALRASARAAIGIDRRVGGSRGDGQGLRDVRLRGAAARLEDLVAALGLTDALES